MSNREISDNKTGTVSLASLPFGVRARVVGINDAGAVARRLMEMGVVPGAPVRLVKAAPFGDPVEVCVRNYRLALRRSELQMIAVIADEK